MTPMPQIVEVTDFADDVEGAPESVPPVRTYPVIMGDYTTGVPWGPRPVVTGTPIAKPTPVFTKLDPSVVEDETQRLRAGADA